MTKPLIELKNLNFAYGKRRIFDNLNLTFEHGSFSVIAGESGSGKSTLLYILGGFQKPARGEYLFSGKRVYGPFGEFGLGRFRKKNIGFLFQDFRLLPFLTVQQNIRFPVLFSGMRLPEKKVQEQMERLGIAHRAEAYPTSISGGEAQRTGLARALLMNPPLLLLDEPTGNLDGITEHAIADVLEGLKKEGLTLVCASHSNYIMQRADCVYDLKDGNITVRGTRSHTVKGAAQKKIL